MHIQTLSWARLSKNVRDSKLLELGLTPQNLEAVRSKEPRERILEATRFALSIDDEPNSDLIEYIAGYGARAGVYHYFRNMKELLDAAGRSTVHSSLPEATSDPSMMDVLTVIPSSIENYPVHMDDQDAGKRFVVWQKVNGGMRSVMINRAVPRLSFLTGILLYAGEGTKSIASSRVEVSNSSPNILRLFIGFLSDLGLPKAKMYARVQIHYPADITEARGYWMEQLRLGPSQFTKPLISSPRKGHRRRTFTLQLSYANTMLLRLLRVWTTDLENMVRSVGNPN